MLSMASTRSTGLGIASGAALYVGAVLGPGVLLVPALAAQAAGPASVLAWVALLAASLAIAATFAALGVRHPVAGGAAAYVRAAYGRVPAAVTGWWFYAGVLGGAPAVWLIGGFYVAHLTGGGRAVAVAAAAAMMVAVLGANARGLHATARMQLGLAALLAVLLLVAIVAALPSAHAANWTPFAPAWMARGRDRGQPADALVRRLGGGRAPGRRLRRSTPAAAARDARGLRHRRRALPGTGGDHGRRPRRRAGSTVPLADLMQRGLGGAASALTAGAAVLLTVGTTNAYVAGATRLAGSLVQEGSMPRWMARPHAPLAVIAAASAAMLGLLAAGLVEVDPIVRAISACFVAVYVAATAAGVRLLDGRLRGAAALSLALVVVVLAFSGPYVVAPAAVALLAGAFVSARAGGAAWRGAPAEPDCRTA